MIRLLSQAFFVAGHMLALGCLVMTGCAPVEPVTTVSIAHAVDFRLLPAAKDFSVTQKVTARFRGESHTLVMQVQASNGQLQLAGMSPMGTRLFSLSFDGKKVDSWKSPLFTAPFDGHYVLADFELAAFDVAVLRKQLSGDARITEEVHGEKISRTILDGEGNAVISIDYADKYHPQQGDISYCHHERHYCLDIVPIAQVGQP